MRWLAVSMKPAPVMAVALRAAASTSSIDRLKRRQLIGVDLDLQRADVAAEHRDFGDARHRQQPRAQRPVGEGAMSINERVVDVSPKTSTVLEEEVSGVIVGGGMLAGNSCAASAKRSDTTWRSR